MTLDQAPLGQVVHVTGTDLAAPLARRLSELGVRDGEPVSALRRTAGGGRLLAVGDTRLAVAQSILRRIEVATE